MRPWSDEDCRPHAKSHADVLLGLCEARLPDGALTRFDLDSRLQIDYSRASDTGVSQTESCVKEAGKLMRFWACILRAPA